MQRNITNAVLAGCILRAGIATATPAVIAHRGASSDAPQNTIPAFNLAWQQGADGIEGDFRMTSDGAIVCIHDATTKKVAAVDMVVSNSTLAELRELDVGLKKGEQWRGTTIPTIDEVLATVPEGKQIFIEIKCGPGILPPLQKAIAASKLKSDQITVIAFDTNVITGVKQQMPRLKAVWLVEFKTKKETGVTRPSTGDVLTTLRQINADGLGCNPHPVVDTSFAEAIKAAVMELHIWTVDDEETATRLNRLGVNSITSNRPDLLLKLFGK